MSKSLKIAFVPEAIQEQIQQIKKLLRLSMNGITSESMQERGLGYRVNYGVALPTLRQMAGRYDQSHDLAQKLWLENIRELRILATMIQPVDKFTEDHANAWVSEITQPEMAEQCSMNLFQHLPFASRLVADWLMQSDVMIRYTAWLVLARITAKGVGMNQLPVAYFITEALRDMQSGHLALFNGALLALKRLGSVNINTAKEILEKVAEGALIEQERKLRILDDLRFDFEYNLGTAL